MGTWQSAINVHCCTIKRDDDDVLSDGEGAEDKGAVCVAHPLSWHSIGSGSANHALAAPPGLDSSFPRSISHATTIPVTR